MRSKILVRLRDLVIFGDFQNNFRPKNEIFKIALPAPRSGSFYWALDLTVTLIDDSGTNIFERTVIVVVFTFHVAWQHTLADSEHIEQPTEY